MKVANLVENCMVLNKLDSTLLDADICMITQDTRSVKKDSLFICIKGTSFDGHDAIQTVLTEGATAVVVERVPSDLTVPYILVKDTSKALAEIASTFYGHSSKRMNLIGVTGTNGKTTTTHLIDHIATFCGQKSGIIGTMYNKVGNEIRPTLNTTPDSLTLQELFYDMHEQGVSTCSMEVSSHGLELGRTWGTDFDIAVFTNFTQDHLDFHGTMEDYFLAKSLLFSQLGNTYDVNNKKTAIVNIDDKYGRKLISLTSANVLTYGCKGSGDIQASDIHITPKGTAFTLHLWEETYEVTTNLIGDFNVYNLLAAFSASYASNFPIDQILEAIKELKGVKGRFQVVPSKEGVTAIVDYAHTPDGLLNVLQTIEKFPNKKTVYCVVGCGGDRDKTKRPLMADISMKYADVSIFTSDNPRTEDPDEILLDMTKHLNKDSYHVEKDRRKGIEKAVEFSKPGDIILVAGKGHEDYQIIGKQKHHFDDCEVLAESALKLEGVTQ